MPSCPYTVLLSVLTAH